MPARFTRSAPKSNVFRRILPSVGIAALLSLCACFLAAIYIPLELYCYNQQEFWFDFFHLAPALLLLFGAGFLFNFALLMLVRLFGEKIFYCAALLESAGFVCSYIQSNFLVSHLPALDGQAPDWTVYGTDNLITAGIWILVLAVICLLAWKLGLKKAVSFARYAVCGITLMLVLTLATVVLTTNGLERKADATITDKDMFSMSTDKNVVFLLLDALDSTLFTDVLSEDTELQQALSDFTYYPNTLGAYPFTSRSVPFIFSGEWFENTESYLDWSFNSFVNGSVIQSAEERGYSLSMYSSQLPLRGSEVFKFTNVINHSAVTSYWKFALRELKVSLFKMLPYAWKAPFLINTSSFQALRSTPAGLSPFAGDNRSFYAGLQEQGLTTEAKPAFRFIHLHGAHVPFNMDENLAPKSNATYEDVVKACATLIKAYIQSLKDAGIYDNTALVILADHGYLTAYRQTPVFMAKGFGQQAEHIKISNAPVSYADLPSAFARLMDGAPSDQIFDAKEGEALQRRFLYYTYLLEDFIDEYCQTGDAWDDTTMAATGIQYTKDVTQDDTYARSFDTLPKTGLPPEIHILRQSADAGLEIAGWGVDYYENLPKAILVEHAGTVFQAAQIYIAELDAGLASAGFRVKIPEIQNSQFNFYVVNKAGELSKAYPYSLNYEKSYSTDLSTLPKTRQLPNIHVDSCNVSGNGFSLVGWGLDSAGNAPSAILVENGGTVYLTRLVIRRDLENRVAGRGLAGFSITLPEVQGNQLRFYVINEAGEISEPYVYEIPS